MCPVLFQQFSLRVLRWVPSGSSKSVTACPPYLPGHGQEEAPGDCILLEGTHISLLIDTRPRHHHNSSYSDHLLMLVTTQEVRDSMISLISSCLIPYHSAHLCFCPSPLVSINPKLTEILLLIFVEVMFNHQ